MDHPPPEFKRPSEIRDQSAVAQGTLDALGTSENQIGTCMEAGVSGLPRVAKAQGAAELWRRSLRTWGVRLLAVNMTIAMAAFLVEFMLRNNLAGSTTSIGSPIVFHAYPWSYWVYAVCLPGILFSFLLMGLGSQRRVPLAS